MASSGYHRLRAASATLQYSSGIIQEGGMGEVLQAAGFPFTERLAVAVSGGVDSMALAILIARWQDRIRQSSSRSNENVTQEAGENPGASVAATCPTLSEASYDIQPSVGLVVDHGLRAASGEEAELTCQRLIGLGLYARVLKVEWPNGRPTIGHIQEEARIARYRLLEDSCQNLGLRVLLTAHHAGDQAELLLLRLGRCSGLVGLGGMRAVREGVTSPHVTLLRPLLGCSKEQLKRMCEGAGEEWVEDPTNQSAAFARNRVRGVLADPAAGLQLEDMNRVGRFCHLASQRVEEKSGELLAKCATSPQDGHVSLHLPTLLTCPCDPTLLHALSASVMIVGRKQAALRQTGVRRLLEHLKQMNKGARGRFIIGGCHVSHSKGSRGTVAMLAPHSQGGCS